uniref:Uncharacterized protein n=1 Tax=Arundo donax TaxID=35708 RepID=A0A0A8XSB7_ARUDO
MRRLARRGH